MRKLIVGLFIVAVLISIPSMACTSVDLSSCYYCCQQEWNVDPLCNGADIDYSCYPHLRACRSDCAGWFTW